MDFGCQCSSSTVTNVPLRWEILIVGEAVHVLGQCVYDNSVFSAWFYCEPTMALKDKVYFKKLVSVPLEEKLLETLDVWISDKLVHH